jgi:glycosyltransferase involved in cell wall biosynthesis
MKSKEYIKKKLLENPRFQILHVNKYKLKHPKKQLIFKYWYRFFERKIIKSASEIITVSDFLKVSIRELVEEVPIHILPNGYDPDVIDEASKNAQSSDFLQIAFVGTIYDWHPIESFLKVFHQFVTQKSSVNIRFNLYRKCKRNYLA